jgi:phage pi2 protein 07
VLTLIDISVDVDQETVRTMLLEKIEQRIKEVDLELVFWSRKDLIRRTSLSWDTIQKTFFYDPRFPKYKVGAKWLFPAEETKEFLLTG